ncbi:EscF/YscF/HrpA family type III secretion system needle major subunit [Dyella sp. M7H15-1]|uniref:type III secretion system needle filament subunit SctF n=1 Tax=Dyella sp. M7H15-1 TaxID=2501295 RepID=UPI001004D9DA|nr:type III secretion system needle filament subunit SctF [Dyella sp. M7H15-1]QAU24832.1 EscF/YscF/HrpA family type III secretion system needle major subunit [Dyella sp. M7H15-1]
MNIDQLVNNMNSNVSQMASNAQSAMQGNVNEDAQAMLRAQYALQQYTLAVSWDSAVMKTMKDMVMSIIQKI